MYTARTKHLEYRDRLTASAERPRVMSIDALGYLYHLGSGAAVLAHDSKRCSCVMPIDLQCGGARERAPCSPTVHRLLRVLACQFISISGPIRVIIN